MNSPANEPVYSYAPRTPERENLKKTLQEMSGRQIEIPLIIGGKEVRTGNTSTVRMPHRHAHVLATWHKAGKQETEQAIQAALAARNDWAAMKLDDRARIFL